MKHLKERITMKSKKVLSFIVVIAILLATITACNVESRSSEKINIVVTIFPQFDWVREIIGDKYDNFDLTMLIGSNADMHSYQPSMNDIARIAAADLFIYVGGHSDDWVEGALAQATNPDMVVINMVESLGDAILMVEHDCGDDECEDDHHDEVELHEEEHVWVSLRMSAILCEIIAQAIIDKDPDNDAVYRENLAAYTAKLDELDGRFTAMAQGAPNDTVVFADRFPFLYMMNDYGIHHYAAFSGCSAESEASFATIVQLSRRIDELDLAFVMITETGRLDIAETIISATQAQNQTILILDGFKAVSSIDIEKGMTYLSVMENNLEVLREALS
jgi:zinc transport system substrate-binding protein